MNHFENDETSALEAIEYAQHIAFAPIVFQATKALRDLGILSIIDKSEKKGITATEIQAELGLSEYGIRVLVEAGLGIGLLTLREGRYHITKTGSYMLHDTMTKVNMDFVNDICYQGMFELDKSIQNTKPEGLKYLGNWDTVYEGLSKLNERQTKSWFDFDHFYSDTSFPQVLKNVFAAKPRKILDIGGNTGKWTTKCLEYDVDVEMGIVDLPGQMAMAKKNLKEKGLDGRVNFHEMNLLDPEAALPKGYDIIWMSQFLDCFSEEQIVSILKRCHSALNDGGQVFILECLWDRQHYKVSAFCLQMTSLYFTNIANGNSQMYSAELFRQLVEKAGFRIEEQIDKLGVSHSLLKCRK